MKTYFHPKFSRILALFGAASALLIAAASAQSISWGNSIGAGCVDSSGGRLSSKWNCELGVFKEGFIPTSANVEQWVANWTLLDSAKMNEKMGFFSSLHRCDKNKASAAGRQGYVWVFNSKEYSRSSEWVLMTDSDGQDDNDWRIPNPATGPRIRTKEWRVANATTVIMGTANGIAGIGDRDRVADKSKVALQTHRLTETVVAAAGDAGKKKTDKAAVAVVPDPDE